jgi:hypothetical protein
MYARSTTVQAHPESIDAGVAYVRDDVMPALLATQGCIGLSLIVDRSTGRCIATSAWQSAEAMHASENAVRPMRDKAAELWGNRAQVDEWEIAHLHRHRTTSDGACVRAVWMRFTPEQLEHALDIYRMVLLPEVEKLDGFCSASLLIDRVGGIACSSVTYDSRDAMVRSRAAAEELRDRAIEETGVEFLEACECDLVLAHLHVPEMAG